MILTNNLSYFPRMFTWNVALLFFPSRVGIIRSAFLPSANGQGD